MGNQNTSGNTNTGSSSNSSNQSNSSRQSSANGNGSSGRPAQQSSQNGTRGNDRPRHPGVIRFVPASQLTPEMLADIERRRRADNSGPGVSRDDRIRNMLLHISPDSFLEQIENAQLEYAMALSRQETERIPTTQPLDPSILLNLRDTVLELEDLEDGSNATCSICLEQQVVGDTALKLPCLHAFHGKCCRSWLERNHTCPVCRLDLNNWYSTHSKEDTVESIKSNGESRQRRLSEKRKLREETLQQQRERLQSIDNENRSEQRNQEMSQETVQIVESNKEAEAEKLASTNVETKLKLSEVETWKVKDLRQVLTSLGLEDDMKLCLQKQELIDLVKKATDFAQTTSKSLNEIKEQLIKMNVSKNEVENIHQVSEAVEKLKTKTSNILDLN